MTTPKDGDIAQYFDSGVDCCAPRRDASRRPGVALAEALRRELRSAGIKDRTVVELGCGRGELCLELLRDGAASATGIDLSPDAIEYARRIAAEDEVSDRVDFRVGNAATSDLPHCDVLVHHRVICCYPDVAAFLENSIGAAGSMYAYSMPRSRGPWGVFVRFALQFENLLHRLKRRGFRAYVHDEAAVHAALTKVGLRLHGRTNRRGWFVAVYVR